MDLFDKKIKKRAREEPFPLPEDYAGRVFRTCASLEEAPMKTHKKRVSNWALGAAAALAVLIAVPNLSPAAAAAMEKVPLLGAAVRVITLRSYVRDNGHAHADVSVPELQGGGSAAAAVNEQAQAYIDRLIGRFEEDCADLGEGHTGLDVSYELVSDTDSWFTLRIDALETKAGGYQFSRIYNIDKAADRVIPLSDLFREDSDWSRALSDEVLRQMNRQMEASSAAVYFVEEFTGVAADQNYYFDAAGELVLVFDEYAVAPGSMGAPEFTVNRGVYAADLR